MRYIIAFSGPGRSWDIPRPALTRYRVGARPNLALLRFKLDPPHSWSGLAEADQFCHPRGLGPYLLKEN